MKLPPLYPWGEGYELIDIFDADRRAVGYVKLRDTAVESGEYYQVAHAWVIDRSGRCLMSRRHPRKTHGLLWECTGGGVHAGESTREAAVRELAEELGLSLSCNEAALALTFRTDLAFCDVYLFRAEPALTDLVLQPEEVVDVRWMTGDEIARGLAAGSMMPSLRYYPRVLAAAGFSGPPKEA